MLPLKRLLWFFVKLVLAYALLIAPWPGLREAYAACFRAGGTLLFSSFGADGRVGFKPAESKRKGLDLEMTLTNQRVPGVGTTVTYNSGLRGYFPTAFLVALIAATPTPWSRRWKSLLWGLLLVNLFVAFRLALMLFQQFSGTHAIALFDPSPFRDGVLRELTVNLVDAPTSHFMVPLFNWIIVAVRRKELEKWLQLRPPAAATNRPRHKTGSVPCAAQGRRAPAK